MQKEKMFFVNKMSQELIDKIKKVYPELEMVSNRDKKFLDYVDKEYEGDIDSFYKQGCFHLNYENFNERPYQSFMVLHMNGKYFMFANKRPEFIDYPHYELNEKYESPFNIDKEQLYEDTMNEALYQLFIRVYNVNGMKNDEDFYVPDESPMEDILPNIIDGKSIEITDKELIEALKKEDYVFDVIVDLEEVRDGDFVSDDDYYDLNGKSLNIEKIMEAINKHSGE